MDGPSQPLALVSVINTVRVLAVTLLNPNNALVGVVPVVNTAVKLASLYQVYVLPPTGAFTLGGIIGSPTQ